MIAGKKTRIKRFRKFIGHDISGKHKLPSRLVSLTGGSSVPPVIITPTITTTLGNNTDVFVESVLEKVSVTLSNPVYKVYFFDHWNGVDWLPTTTLIKLSGFTVAHINHTIDRIGQRIGFSTIAGATAPTYYGTLKNSGEIIF